MSKHSRILIVFAGLALSVIGLQKLRMMKTRPLLVGFPTNILFKNSNLLDSTNLETTQEYYLLENLAGTLIRYSDLMESNYNGFLADSWTISNNSIRFKLRPELRWSDGSPILPEEIVENFIRLKNSSSRHLRILTQVQLVYFERVSKSLVLQFKTKVPYGLLHELTLADSSILRMRNGRVDWKTTSGHYFVDSVDESLRIVTLKRNKNSALVSASSSPDKVVLSELPEDPGKIFDSKGSAFDYIAPQAFTFSSKSKLIFDQAPKKIEGQPSVVHFISFLKSQPKVREIVKRVVAELRPNAESVSKNLIPYDQVIPAGYNGFLTDYHETSNELYPAGKFTLKLYVRPQYKPIDDWFKAFISLLALKGIELKVQYAEVSEVDLYKEIDQNVAIFAVFKGNMKDPLGSWSFLSDQKHGALRGYVDQVSPYLKQAEVASNESEKVRALQKLHRLVLLEGYMIWNGPPFDRTLL